MASRDFDRKFEGNARNNTINGTTLRDKIEGYGGADVLSGLDGADKIDGGAGADRLFGGNGNDHLEGGFGADLLFGGGGADKLESGQGNDVMSGGAGRDSFVYYRGDDNDIVSDFVDNIDRIDLTAFNFSNARAAKSFASNVSGDVVFNFGNGDTLTIDNITLSQLTAVDFIL